MKTITFLGHRKINDYNKIKQLLVEILKNKIENGYSNFLVGRRGDFDKIALQSCLECKKMNERKINISVVLTNLSILNKDSNSNYVINNLKTLGCETIFYNVELEHFKNRIIASNKKMIDDSDLIICYVDMMKRESGAKKAIKYAIKRGKLIINLFN